MPTPPNKEEPTLSDLLPFANETQADKIAARIELGNNCAAARALGCSETQIRRAIRSCQRKYWVSDLRKGEGWVPVEVTSHYDDDGNLRGTSLREQPEDIEETGGQGAGDARDGGGPYVVKGISTYFNANGEQRGQWIKTRLDDLRRTEMMNAAAAAMSESLPRVEPIAAPSVTDPDLLNLYILTDAHIGMLAWHREGGADWDLAIAERTITGCFRQMIRGAPKAQTAIIGQLGDLLHYDGLLPVTPTSGHVLDADSRFAKMVEVAVRVLRRVVTMALEKHQRVILLPAEGNHDLASSVWLRTMFAALYENEPRVEVDTTANPFYAHQHGQVMLCFHHGHMTKNDNLPSIFAEQYAVMWGATTKRFAHCGDKHHAERKEHRGMEVEQHPTLAARDAYASRHGYHAMRRTNAITYHASFGEVGRVTVSPEMVEAA